MDPRGFGHSEGTRALFESEEIMIEDQLKFYDSINDKFGGKDVPKLQLGYSLGGLASVKLSILRPSFFQGQGLITPYFELLNRDVIDSKLGMAKFVDKFWPSFKAPIPL